MAKETKQTGVRIPVDLLERIDYLAEIEHRDRSNMIVHILSMYVESLEAERKAWENSER